jgi:hypothetical protein
MILLILSISAVAFIAYNLYTAHQLKAEIIIKNSIIAALQTQVEVVLTAKAELIRQLNSTSKAVVQTETEKPAIFSKKKASAKPAKV